jgi:hypothetical protein
MNNSSHAQRVMAKIEEKRIAHLVNLAQELRNILTEADAIANELRKEGYNVKFSQMESRITGSGALLPGETIISVKNSGALIAHINREDTL